MADPNPNPSPNPNPTPDPNPTPTPNQVLPSWRRPEDLASSPYLHPELETGRPNLFYFNGNLGRTAQVNLTSP